MGELSAPARAPKVHMLTHPLVPLRHTIDLHHNRANLHMPRTGPLPSLNGWPTRLPRRLNEHTMHIHPTIREKTRVSVIAFSAQFVSSPNHMSLLDQD